MFAVIRAGGRQYRVAANDVIEIDRIDAEIGQTVDFPVLMLGGETPAFGAPLVEGAAVTGEVVDHHRGPKVIAFKKRRRKNSKRTRGHRQHHTMVRITDILASGGVRPAAAKAEAPASEPALTPLFTTPEGPADDLKLISGVGPVLEGKLNALGITTFAQIAAFTEAEIAQVDEVLNFKGRIERENWIGQAAEFAAKANG